MNLTTDTARIDETSQPQQEPSPTGAFDARHPYGAQPVRRRNFLALTAYQVLLRIGWIFKTESIIMPAFLDIIAGAGWIRGCLPAMNRFGQSVPPVLFSERLRSMPRKKWALVIFQLMMAATFLVLAAMWYFAGGVPRPWMPAAFLLLYGLFFSCTGLAQLAGGTLQGKLVRPNRRGRLLMVSTTIGSVLSIAAAWWLLGGWLATPKSGFTMIFAFTGGFFVLAAIASAALQEFADGDDPDRKPSRGRFRDAWEVLCIDANFRRLAVVAMLFGVVLMLFPHYQALARERLGNSLNHLMIWVIVQNAGVGLFSIFVGPLADRRGNRLILHLALFVNALAPLLALYLSRQGAFGDRWFWLVFGMLGMTPVTFKVLLNYTLEISKTADHPKYLSTLSLCLALPPMLSPLAGWLVDAAGFEVVLGGGALLILTGALLSFTLEEPRHTLRGAEELSELET
ncbi:MAG: MFS transporter [Pirellulales bacterium]